MWYLKSDGEISHEKRKTHSIQRYFKAKLYTENEGCRMEGNHRDKIMTMFIDSCKWKISQKVIKFPWISSFVISKFITRRKKPVCMCMLWICDGNSIVKNKLNESLAVQRVKWTKFSELHVFRANHHAISWTFDNFQANKRKFASKSKHFPWIDINHPSNNGATLTKWNKTKATTQ